MISSLARGGAERSCIKLGNLLATSGWDVHVIALAAKREQIEEPLDERVTIHTLRNRRTADARLWLELGASLRRLAPQLVLGWATYASLATLVATRGGREFPVVACERNYLPQVFSRRRAHWLRRALTLSAVKRLYPLATMITANSQHATAFLERWLSCDVPCRWLPNSVDDAVLHSAAAVPTDLPPNWGPARLLAVGRLEPQKGIDVLLRALQRVTGEWGLLIVGDGPEYRALRSLSVELGIGNRVLWAGTLANPFPYYVAADVLVMPSRFEGFPNVMLEAMALGCPVVATACQCGPDEMSLRGAYARLVPVDDPEALSSALNNVLANPGESRVRAAEGRRFVLSRHGADGVRRNVQQVLEEALLSAQARPQSPSC